MLRAHRGRALPLALLLLVLAGSSALARPKVAVLGLEVTGTIDQASTTVARELTEGLRSRARSGDGPYQLAPNSNRELIDEKLIKQCDDEAAACMAEIGQEVGADFLIYGRVAKEGAGYRVTLHVLDVQQKAHDKEHTLAVPRGTSGDGTRALAKQAYTELVGDRAPAPGTLIVKANVPTGTVLIDDVARDTLSAGAATIALPEGRYRLAIETAGHRREEVIVLIPGGETVIQNLELRTRASGGGGFNVWKPVFGVALAATVALAAYSYLEYDKMNEAALLATPPGITNEACSDPSNVDPNFVAACGHHGTHVTTAWAAVGVGLLTAGAGYMAFIHGDAPRTAEVAITPVVTPDGAGATMFVAW